MELVDCHTHTIYSDGGSTLDENIAAAEARGLTTIACTDHFAHPAFMDCAVDESRIAELGSRIEQARLSHPNIDIVFGWEADWYEGCEQRHSSVQGGGNVSSGLGALSRRVRHRLVGRYAHLGCRRSRRSMASIRPGLVPRMLLPRRL